MRDFLAMLDDVANVIVIGIVLLLVVEFLRAGRPELTPEERWQRERDEADAEDWWDHQEGLLP